MSLSQRMLLLVVLAAGCAGGAPAVTAVDVAEPKPAASSMTSAGTAPDRDEPTEAEIAALPSLTWTKADQALKARGCESFDPTWDYDGNHGATCTLPGGAKLRFQQVTAPHGYSNDVVLGQMPRGAAFVQQGRLILIASVERNGLLDDMASRRLLRELLVAASGEEPFAVVRAPAGTWVSPSLVDVPSGGKRIEPTLVADLVKALIALGYRDAVEISYSTNTPQSTQPHSEVSARVGLWESADALYVDVFCGAPDAEPKETEAMPGEAIWITGPCWMIANVEMGGVRARAASKKLLEDLLASPRP